MSPEPETMQPEKMRIAKYCARAGVASRRALEQMITEGRVVVNGNMIHTPTIFVNEQDIIEIDGQIITPPQETRLYKFHKPKQVITTRMDPQGRTTIFDILPPEHRNLINVGRLDYNSEGLLLLTNNGALARQLTLPKNGWERVYRVRINGHLSRETIKQMAGGVEIDGIQYQPIECFDIQPRGDNCWLSLTLTEGKNREIRTIMDYFGHGVSRLIRISFGKFQLGDLPPGDITEIPNHLIPPLLAGE